jgi:nucleoid DNA-binding protein
MTKKDIAKKISEETGLKQQRVQQVVQMVFDGIIETLATEGRVELRNLGVFEVKRRKARAGRNPRTGERVSVPERLTVTFKAGREMGQQVVRAAAASRPGEGGIRAPAS